MVITNDITKCNNEILCQSNNSKLRLPMNISTNKIIKVWCQLKNPWWLKIKITQGTHIEVDGGE